MLLHMDYRPRPGLARDLRGAEVARVEPKSGGEGGGMTE